MQMVKRIQEEEEVNGTYILLSGTLAVVTSAVRGMLQALLLYMLNVVHPKIHPFVRL